MANEIIKPISIFLGPSGSGKSRLAREVASQYPEKQVTMFPAPPIKEVIASHFLFSGCSLHTRLLIVDDIQSLDALFHWIRRTYRYVIVEPQGKKPFLISPEVILIGKENITREQIDAMGLTIANRCIVHEVEEYMCPTASATTGMGDSNNCNAITK